MHGVVFEIFVWGRSSKAPGHVRVPDRWRFAFAVMASQVFLATTAAAPPRDFRHPHRQSLPVVSA